MTALRLTLTPARRLARGRATLLRQEQALHRRRVRLGLRRLRARIAANP